MWLKELMRSSVCARPLWKRLCPNRWPSYQRIKPHCYGDRCEMQSLKLQRTHCRPRRRLLTHSDSSKQACAVGVGIRKTGSILFAGRSEANEKDTLPKFGHSTYRADFGIPSLGLLIEVKFATDARDFKEIEKEALEDIVPYLRTPERYHEILFFIYDDSCSVQNHDTTIRALRSVPGVADVVIVCRPSHLPRAAEQLQ